MNSALLFPGQGSQYVGMGTDFLDIDKLQEWFENVNQKVQFPLSKLLHDGPESELEKTRYTQPAVFTVNHLIYKYLHNSSIQSNYFAGHSLGEYNALVAANRSTFKEVLPVVIERGKAMDDAAQNVDGVMAAILRYDVSKLEQLCQTVSKDSSISGTVQVALYNSPSELVVSGSEESVEAIIQKSSEDGALKSVKLDVSGPWHSQYMEPAVKPLRSALRSVEWEEGSPVYMNVTAEECDVEEISNNLLRQLRHPVLWTKTVKNFVDEGVKTFIEVGPGSALNGMLKRISKNMDEELTYYKTDTLSHTQEILEEF